MRKSLCWKQAVKNISGCSVNSSTTSMSKTPARWELLLQTVTLSSPGLVFSGVFLVPVCLNSQKVSPSLSPTGPMQTTLLDLDSLARHLADCIRRSGILKKKKNQPLWKLIYTVTWSHVCTKLLESPCYYAGLGPNSLHNRIQLDI